MVKKRKMDKTFLTNRRLNNENLLLGYCREGELKNFFQINFSKNTRKQEIFPSPIFACCNLRHIRASRSNFWKSNVEQRETYGLRNYFKTFSLEFRLGCWIIGFKLQMQTNIKVTSFTSSGQFFRVYYFGCEFQSRIFMHTATHNRKRSSAKLKLVKINKKYLFKKSVASFFFFFLFNLLLWNAKFIF